MKMDNKRRRPSPLFVVLTTAAVVIIATTLLGWLNARSHRVRARVEIADPVIDNREAKSSIPRDSSSLPDGEVSRMAIRVRESTGLLMVLATLAVSEQMNNRNHPEVDSLVRLMAARNLIPPGINQSPTSAVLSSEHAAIHIRYRPQPLGIEVVSIGREKIDGPALITRLTVGGDDTTGALLLIARKTQDTTLPVAFASVAQVTALNWSVEPLRERSFTPQEVEQLNIWANQYGATNK